MAAVRSDPVSVEDSAVKATEPSAFAPFGNFTIAARVQEDRRFAGRTQMDKQTSGRRDGIGEADRQTDGGTAEESGRNKDDCDLQTRESVNLQVAQT